MLYMQSSKARPARNTQMSIFQARPVELKKRALPNNRIHGPRRTAHCRHEAGQHRRTVTRAGVFCRLIGVKGQ